MGVDFSTIKPWGMQFFGIIGRGSGLRAKVKYHLSGHDYPAYRKGPTGLCRVLNLIGQNRPNILDLLHLGQATHGSA